MLINSVEGGTGGILLALCVKIYPANRSLDLVEADIVKAFKTCATDCPDPVIWNQKVLLPSHKYVFSLRQAGNVEVTFPGLFLKRSEGREFGPMRKIRLI